MEDRNGRRLNASTTASLRPYVVKLTTPSRRPKGNIIMPSTEVITKTLGGTNLFAGLDSNTLKRIAAICKVDDHDANEVLYRPGDKVSNIYVLLSGRVSCRLLSHGQSQSSGSVISSRMVFGWAALIPEHPRRIATAQCIEPSTILAINGDDLLEILQSEPQAGFLVMRRLTAMIARNFMDRDT